ncbi:DUF1707 domain-containing protein [Amycolatopsis sp. VS8301801F10]|uniref:DUF1707 SHOCT-like domain-containing protein n=1 Tax=Amycolatopsis sp. VS8301801F10 TaxID=2652442 RepID=UPI0038FC2E6B
MSGGELEPRGGGEVARENERASDADRNRAVELLRQAVGDGLLSLDEFSNRVDVVLAAETWGQVESVLAEFPGLSLMAPEAPFPDPPALVLRTTSGSVKQEGEWAVPQRILAQCGSGRVRIDFTHALCRHKEILLEVVCTGSGQVHLTVPRGWMIRIEELSTTSGRVVDKAADPHVPGSPLIRVSGELASGRLKVKHPRDA